MKRLNRVMSWNGWDISMTLFPVLPVFWWNNGGFCGGKYLLKTPGKAISENLNFKMSLDASALYAFGVSSANYSLSAAT